MIESLQKYKQEIQVEANQNKGLSDFFIKGLEQLNDEVASSVAPVEKVNQRTRNQS